MSKANTNVPVKQPTTEDDIEIYQPFSGQKKPAKTQDPKKNSIPEDPKPTHKLEKPKPEKSHYSAKTNIGSSGHCDDSECELCPGK